MKQTRKTKHPYSAHNRNNLYLALLLLIPVLIVTVVNFFILYQDNMKVVEEDLRMESERSLSILNTQMNSMLNIVSLKRTDKTFATKEQEKIGTIYYPIRQQLQKDAVWTSFFSEVNFYSLQNGMVYSANCATPAQEYFGSKNETSYYINNSFEMQPEDQLSLKKTGNHIRAIRLRNVEGNGDGVMLAIPLELRTGAAPLSYMLFTISDTMLTNISGNVGDGATNVIYYNGIPIYSSDPAIRQDLYEGKDLPEEFSGSNGLTFSQENIDISWHISKQFQLKRLIPIITMEAVTTFLVTAIGLLLLLHISRKNYEPIYNLLQKLPPRTEDDSPVNEFKYIDFVLDDLTYSKRFYKESVQELRHEKYFFYIFDNQVEPNGALYQQCLAEGIRVDRTYFACILIEDSEKNYLLFEQLMFEKEQNHAMTDCYSMYVLENKYLFFLTADLPKPEFEAYLHSLVDITSEPVRMSEIIEGIRNVRTAYTSVCRSELSMKEKIEEQYPLMELQLLQEAMETDNMDKVEFALRMIKSDFGSYEKKVRTTVLEKIGQLLSSENPQQYADLTELPLDVADEETCCHLLDELLMRFISGKRQTIPVKKVLPRNLHTIMNYIKDHYASPEFSIKYMAAVFGTSPSNLSHQFKKLTGETLSRFIDELRISKAEELLMNGEKIHVIAQKLGYSTTPVFTETYKRVRGTTPSNYRSSISAEK